MKYRKELNDFAKALALDKSQVTRLDNAIQKAYEQEWHKDGPNIDQIYFFMAPYIKTQEEAFYVANTVMANVTVAMLESGKTFK
jgi:hypothetical protein